MPETPEDRLAGILAARKAKDDAAQQAAEQVRTNDAEEVRRMDAWRSQFTEQVVPKIVAAQQRAEAVIGNGGYALMHIHSRVEHHLFGPMPNSAYQLNCPPRANGSQTEKALPPVPAIISFALTRDGQVQSTVAGLADSSVEIDKFTEDDAMNEFERFIRHALLGG